MKKKINVKKCIIIAVCVVLLLGCIWFKFPRTLNSFVALEDISSIAITVIDENLENIEDGSSIKNATIEDPSKVAEFCKNMYTYRFSRKVFDNSENYSSAKERRIFVNFCTTLDDGGTEYVTLEVTDFDSVSITGVGVEDEPKTYSTDWFGNKNMQEIYNYALEAFNANYAG